MSRSDTNQKEYISPFSARYVSTEMSYLFSPYYKALLFRKLWISLAKAQHKLGLPIKKGQIAILQKNATNIDFAKIYEYEKKLRHDVMAHIHAFGDLCPIAKPILHLGATSTFATDNADLIQMKEALQLLHRKLIHVLHKLTIFTKKYANSPCLAYTHYQSAQPTTIGKRASLWLQDLFLDAQEWERLFSHLPFLGAKGATGTQSSFLSLFKDNTNKVQKLEELIAHEFGFTTILPIAGQTYPRKLDLNILNAFESFAASAHKMATDLRLLAHDGEIAEGFGKSQVGSSAMPYKKNPIYSERICGIARFVISLSQNPSYTLANQWLERTLDDSSNRRFAIPEAFLGVDAILNLLIHVLSSLTAFPQISLQRLKAEISFLTLENILMAAVNKGGDRQALHEKLRQISLSSRKKKNPNTVLLSEIEKDPSFNLTRREIKPLLSIASLIGRAPDQTRDFLKKQIEPYLAKHKKQKTRLTPVDV